MIYYLTPVLYFQDRAYIFELDDFDFNIFVSHPANSEKIAAFDKSSKKYLNSKKAEIPDKMKKVTVKEMPISILREMISKTFTKGIRKI